jgi:hypothetical protein
MRNSMEINNLDRDTYTQLQKIDTTIGVILLLMFAVALAI